MAKIYYRGFSTQNFLDKRTTLLTNIQLVNRDLLNHIFTLKGERVMMADFGTRIPLLAFEPADAQTIKIIDTDLKEVFNYDPRVKLLALQIIPLPNNNAIVAFADLLYVEFDVRDTLNIEIPTGK